jgi:hypothetical protein
MRCESCHGTGQLAAAGDDVLSCAAAGPPLALPCPECGGCGIAHCCDGITACNDLPEQATATTRIAPIAAGPALT